MATATCNDRDYERIFFGDRQVNPTHFFAINWTEDTGRPLSFAFGYWTHDGIYRQGFVKYDHFAGAFRQPVFNTNN